MPVVESSIVVPVPPEVAFWVSQTHGAPRYRWDPFVREQHLVGADEPDKGVRTATVSRHRLRMVSEYVSFNPPRNVGMRMVSGPWFFAKFAGGWRFEDGPDAGTTRAVWRYHFAVRPSWLAPVGDPIGVRLLGRDIERRIAGFARGCGDEVVLAAALAARQARTE